MPSRISQVLQPGNLAVIAGAASGIGRATARHFASLGLNVFIADVDANQLAQTQRDIQAAHPTVTVRAVPTDVSSQASVASLAEAVRAANLGPVRFLMNCAGIGAGGGAFADKAAWDRTMGVNFGGVLHGSQAFVPAMVESGLTCFVVNVGSKQGITAPPGNLAYNVSKSAVKLYTEGLQHELRNKPAPSDVSAHLLVPGWVNSDIIVKSMKEKITSGEVDASKLFSEENPAKGAWMPSQVVQFLLDALEKEQFYILCPDNEVDLATDHKRILWAAGDIVENRTPLSRWDPKYADDFKAFLAK
ncbi:hypothetical protein DFJ73DRAFT_619414 [Zopfochytrium polystomum]|nr:hypothetical protein DFJ73DRAFT_619414 [Zopfochytrium polystomum]